MSRSHKKDSMYLGAPLTCLAFGRGLFAMVVIEIGFQILSVFYLGAQGFHHLLALGGLFAVVIMEIGFQIQKIPAQPSRQFLYLLVA